MENILMGYIGAGVYGCVLKDFPRALHGIFGPEHLKEVAPKEDRPEVF